MVPKGSGIASKAKNIIPHHLWQYKIFICPKLCNGLDDCP